MQGSTLKMSATFDDTTALESGGSPSLITIINKNITVKNGYLLGDLALTGLKWTNCGVLIGTDTVAEAENTLLENLHATNTRGIAFLCFGGTKNTRIKGCSANNCGGLAGIEIWSATMNPPENICFENLSGTNELGIYIAGCNGLSIKNVNAIATNGSSLTLYGGDAKGNLVNCSVDDSYFKTTSAISTFIMNGIVASGTFTGFQMNVRAKINNCIFENIISQIAEFKGKCVPIIDNCIFLNGSTGIVITDCDKQFIMRNSKVSTVQNRCANIYDKATFENCTFENANLALNGTIGDIVYFSAGSSNSLFKNCRIGKLTGENGRYALNGVTTILNLVLQDIEMYGATGTNAIPSSQLTTFDMKNLTGQTLLIQPKMVLYNAIPTFGTWKKGDIVINSNLTIGTPFGWICISAGTPGTWGILPNVV